MSLSGGFSGWLRLAHKKTLIVQLKLIRVVPLITFYSGNNYSGTSIKRTPLGNSRYREVVFIEVSRANHSMLYE